MASSMSSASLWPPRAKNLSPLSGIGLWLAEMTAPRSAPRSAVRNATPGVGSTPTSRTSTPALARPATTAAVRNSPEARGSRPTTASGRWPAKAPVSARTCAAATDRSSASSAVTSRLATPRTPSVPNSRAPVLLFLGSSGRAGRCPDTPTAPGNRTPPGPSCGRAGSALAVLRGLAGLLQTGLLALGGARVAGEEAGLLQGRAVHLGVHAVQGAGHAQAHRAGLAGGATTVHAGEHVVGAVELEHLERLAH